MGQRRRSPTKFIVPAIALLVGCGKGSTPANPTTTSTTAPAVKTVASLVPAVTDLIIGMGAGDRLVAVSTYDRQRPDVASLPKVGDYQTVDWEQLQLIKPSILIIDIRADRRPAGFNERADGLHMQLVNISINRLNDVFAAIDQVGEALEMPQQAADANRSLKTRLDAIAKRSADQNLPPVRTLLVVGESGQFVAGPNTYLDDLLKTAGGMNVAEHLGSYPQIDREMLISLKPDVIIQLLPQPSPQEREQAARTWRDLPQVPAVAAGRVYTIDSWYALLPGWHVADLAYKIAECLHPPTPSSMPTTATAPARSAP